jgi:NitT/TauT family transport system permease protein
MTESKRIILSLTGFITFIAVWQTISFLGIFPQGLLPSPIAVLAAIFELWERDVLIGHIFDSLYRFFAGYTLAAVLAVPFGLLTGWSRKLNALFEPLLQMLRPISPVASCDFVVWNREQTYDFHNLSGGVFSHYLVCDIIG